MRRKKGALIPIEVAILSAALDLEDAGTPEFHGYALARQMRGVESGRVAGQGTLYDALVRLEDAGLLQSRWEAKSVAQAAGRPRRRFYRLTPAGVRALAQAHAALSRGMLRERPVES